VYRIAIAATVLTVLIAALPIRLTRASTGATGESCLRLADHPAADGPEALNELERCRAVVPEDLELLADLGAAYARVGRPLDAEKAYQDVLALDPSYAEVRVELATLLLARGATTEARDHVEQALRVQPNRNELRQLLEMITRSQTK
jgi:Flp pilus assembly protein TadD